MTIRGPRCAALATLLVLAVSGCGEDTGPRAEDPQVTTSPGTPTVPADLTCASDRRETGEIDYIQFPGLESPEDAAARFLRDGERIAVERIDHDDANDWVLRPDGTARMRVTVRRASEGWYPDTIESCEGEGPGTAATPPPPRSTPVLLDIGHCWVEPFEFDGEEWALASDDQFGWGGRFPEGISGEGTAVRGTTFDDTLTYTDVNGGTLVLRPTSDPRTELPGGTCD